MHFFITENLCGKLAGRTSLINDEQHRVDDNHQQSGLRSQVIIGESFSGLCILRIPDLSMNSVFEPARFFGDVNTKDNTSDSFEVFRCKRPFFR